MTEEAKQETKEEAQQEVAAEVKPAPEQPKAKPAAVAVIVGRGKGSRPKQCAQCSKNLKKKTWYYRANKYFCNKRCWKASTVPKPVAA